VDEAAEAADGATERSAVGFYSRPRAASLWGLLFGVSLCSLDSIEVVHLLRFAHRQCLQASAVGFYIFKIKERNRSSAFQNLRCLAD
jgi:hypothetical protein